MAVTIEAEIAASLESFRWNEAEYQRMIHGPVMATLVKRAIRVQSAAVRSMGREAPPSTPGYPPAVVTGLLRRSITWRPGTDAISPYVDVGTAVFYAPFLEQGTSRMAARPFLRPALAAARTDEFI